MELLERFKLLAPEFKEREDAEITKYLEMADESVTTDMRHPLRSEAVVYLAAYNMNLALKRKGSGGMVTSVTEGKLNIKYAENQNIRSSYDLCGYGRRYQEVIRRAIITPMTRSC